MTGAWKIEVAVDAMPQAVATAVSKVNETLLGAEYTPIAYLGEQIVNGTNYAVLAEQLIVSGKDTKNVVVLIFNQKPGQVGDASLAAVERVVESGDALGGTVVDVKTKIPEEAKAVFAEAFEGFVGSKVEPIALLATQVTTGTDYIFAAELTTVTAEPVKKAVLVRVNAVTKKVDIADLLTAKAGFGYAFNW